MTDATLAWTRTLGARRRPVPLLLWRVLLVFGLAVLALHDATGLGRSHGALIDTWLYDGLELLAA
ncbi:MAG TPA: hypothetical protein VNH40_09765, partial [Gaiellaceae bacterium]|nr:hypothetical protein [Gaiellaceae bacterium]